VEKLAKPGTIDSYAGPLRLCSGQAFDFVRRSPYFAQDDKTKKAGLNRAGCIAKHQTLRSETAPETLE